jgi:hypothetical protein
MSTLVQSSVIQYFLFDIFSLPAVLKACARQAGKFEIRYSKFSYAIPSFSLSEFSATCSASSIS